MRSLFVVSLLGLTAALLTAGQSFADTIVVKGPHICCPQCVTVAQKLLEKIDGVSDAKADAKSKTVTFTAKDAAATKAGIEALTKGGFSGTATSDGKEFKVALPAVEKGDKVAAVVVKDVHVCCGQCQNAVKATFKGAKVTFEGKGAQRTVRIEGDDLYVGTVVEALRKAGFNGTPEK
jgi:copper chaperone CopZ